MIARPFVKVNLGLSVLRRREDGFHDLETLFVPYKGISDTLEIVRGDDFSLTSASLFSRYSPSQIAQAISEDGKLMITIARAEGVDWDPLKDLTAKAYSLLAADFQLPPVKIFLEKTSPVGAGLGGGSADAAFALRMLSELCALGLSDSALAAYAAQLGSDCAFFVYDRPMLGEGRGELLTPFDCSSLGTTSLPASSLGLSADSVSSSGTSSRGVNPLDASSLGVSALGAIEGASPATGCVAATAQGFSDASCGTSAESGYGISPSGLPLIAGLELRVVIPSGISVSTKEAYGGIIPRDRLAASAPSGSAAASSAAASAPSGSAPVGFTPSASVPSDSPVEPSAAHACLMPLREALALPVTAWKDALVNDFERTVFAVHPELARLKQELYDNGAVYASMSGSGSALFGLFPLSRK